MAEIKLGSSEQLVLGGTLDLRTLTNVEDELRGAVDLSTFYGPDSKIDEIREMAGMVRSPADPAWSRAVTELYGQVDTVTQSIRAVNLGNIAMTDAAPAVPNPKFRPLTSGDGGTKKISTTPERKYVFLKKQSSLLELGVPVGSPAALPKNNRHGLSPTAVKDLAVRIHFEEKFEPMDEEETQVLRDSEHAEARRAKKRGANNNRIPILATAHPNAKRRTHYINRQPPRF
ncbi:MAG: hypothetical protein AAB462_02645 [Patescibacteria group bacterium]